jgi:single-stranded-DNA-specific exonuclease
LRSAHGTVDLIGIHPGEARSASQSGAFRPCWDPGAPSTRVPYANCYLYTQLTGITEKRWYLRKPHPDRIEQLKATSFYDSLPEILVQLLALRGVTGEKEIARFLHPRLQDLGDPFLLPDMDKAVARILQAVDRKETVVIYGDYDVDGVTSITLLKSILLAYGLEPRTFLPHRMEEGYGISMDGLDKCRAEGPMDLLIAVDCGTTSIAELAPLAKEGTDVVIFDHHECSQAGRPNCVALVNPKAGDTYHYLCSAGVVFKLGHALLKQRWLENFELREFLDIAALGTVSDIVPLVDENRLIVRKGLLQLERTRHAGLRALLNAMDIGFRMGPRLNASGRLASAQASLDLLMCQDDEEAMIIAQELDGNNRDRQGVEETIVREAEAQIEADLDMTSAGFVLGSDGWHPGVVGIVASRIMRRYHRPTFVIAFDEDGIGKGSGRSITGISLVDIINSSRDLLLKGGGHDMAAGISIEKDKFLAFRERFAKEVGAAASADHFHPKLMLDVETRLTDLRPEVLDNYELLEPFGSSNPQPLFYARAVRPKQPPRMLKEKHMQMVLTQDDAERDAVWFSVGPVVLPKPPWDIAFYIQRTQFRGRLRIQILIQALRKTKAYPETVIVGAPEEEAAAAD